MGFGRRNGGHELDFGDEPRPRWLLFGIVALVVVAAMVLFFVVRGSSQTAEGPPAGISTTEDFNPASGENTMGSTTDTTMSSTASQESRAKTTAEPTESEGEESDAGTASDSQDDSGGGENGDTGDGSDGPEDPEDPEDPEGSDESIRRAGPEPGGIAASNGGGEGDRQAESESAAKETGVWDPAGKNPDPGDLTVTDEQRVEFAASQFVTAVYGYTGTDAEQYRNDIDRMVVGEEFYESAGGEKVLEYVEEVDVYGSQAAAKVDRFEVTETELGKVTGTVYFDTADSYSRYGDLEGDKASYTQKLILVAEGETYSVFSAETRESGEES